MTFGDDDEANPDAGRITGRLAFVHHGASGRSSIHVMNAHGSDRLALTSGSEPLEGEGAEILGQLGAAPVTRHAEDTLS